MYHFVRQGCDPQRVHQQPEDHADTIKKLQQQLEKQNATIKELKLKLKEQNKAVAVAPLNSDVHSDVGNWEKGTYGFDFDPDGLIILQAAPGSPLQKYKGWQILKVDDRAVQGGIELGVVFKEVAGTKATLTFALKVHASRRTPFHFSFFPKEGLPLWSFSQFDVRVGVYMV